MAHFKQHQWRNRWSDFVCRRFILNSKKLRFSKITHHNQIFFIPQLFIQNEWSRLQLTTIFETKINHLCLQTKHIYRHFHLWTPSQHQSESIRWIFIKIKHYSVVMVTHLSRSHHVTWPIKDTEFEIIYDAKNRATLSRYNLITLWSQIRRRPLQVIKCFHLC